MQHVQESRSTRAFESEVAHGLRAGVGLLWTVHLSCDQPIWSLIMITFCRVAHTSRDKPRGKKSLAWLFLLSASSWANVQSVPALSSWMETASLFTVWIKPNRTGIWKLDILHSTVSGFQAENRVSYRYWNRLGICAIPWLHAVLSAGIYLSVGYIIVVWLLVPSLSASCL